MRAVELVGAVTDPQQVRGAVVPVAGDAVAAGQRLFVPEQQRFVRRVEVDLVQLGFVLQVDAARGHEPECAIDLLRELVVALAFATAGNEFEVPLVGAAEIGEAALRERTQQVERRRGLVVAAHHPLGVGATGPGLEFEVVDDVAEVRRQLDAVSPLDRCRARLGELSRDAADLQGRHAGAVGEHERHLEDHLQLVADAVGREVGERLGAVACVQQEPVAFGDARQGGA